MKTMQTMKTMKTMTTMKTTQVTEEEEGKSNAGGSEGKTTIPAKKFLQQVSDILKVPLIQVGVVSPGAQGSAALPQATEVEEAKQAAGDPIGDEAAIA